MSIKEIAADVYRLSIFVPQIDLQFNQFLVADDEPLLFHTGMKSMFPAVREMVAKVIDPADLRWVGFSHFEADECGALNEWLEIAPNAQGLCSQVGALVSVNDFAVRPARGLADGETFSTGKHHFRFVQTPHLPHCWEAGLLFEETGKTLFCSDLFLQNGDVKAFTDENVMDAVRDSMIAGQQSPFADATPYTQQTEANLQKLEALEPKTFAVMHGSSFAGNGTNILRDFGAVMREVLLPQQD
ncbi:MAG: MBL fold metallo-hydrolase [Pyrinomonadaceae bacterium]